MSRAVLRSDAPAPVRLDVAAPAWIAWAVVALLALRSQSSPWVPTCVMATVVVVWWLRGRERAGLGAWFAGVGAAVAAVWVLVTLAVGPGTGGDVVWVLPEWSPTSGAPVGGPITTGRLATGAQMAWQALAHLALLALVARCVSGESLARLADVVLGDAARLVHTMCFLPAEVAQAERERPALLAHGLRPHGPREILGRASRRADHWRAARGPREGGVAARVRLLAGVAVASLALAAAVRRSVSGVEATAAALLVVLLAGALTSRPRVSHDDPADFAPLAAAAVVVGAIVVAEDPVVVALSLLALPVAQVVLEARRPARRTS